MFFFVFALRLLLRILNSKISTDAKVMRKKMNFFKRVYTHFFLSNGIKKLYSKLFSYATHSNFKNIRRHKEKFNDLKIKRKM